MCNTRAYMCRWVRAIAIIADRCVQQQRCSVFVRIYFCSDANLRTAENVMSVLCAVPSRTTRYCCCSVGFEENTVRAHSDNGFSFFKRHTSEKPIIRNRMQMYELTVLPPRS